LNNDFINSKFLCIFVPNKPIMKIKAFLLVFTALAFFATCGTKKNGQKRHFNMYTLAQDRELGANTAHYLDSNQREYPSLDSLKYQEAYRYLYKIRDAILNSGKVIHRDDFAWRLRIIHDDSTLNAFCTPGGYIYVYTGLMKYLDSEDQLAGVMGHEIAHADCRHSTRQMTDMGLIGAGAQIVTGGRANMAQIVSGLIGLKFSRNHETEADGKSVEYLCPTAYHANGGARFFEKLEAAGSGRQPAFLSTHPAPKDRIEHFNNLATTMGCTGKSDFASEYKRMIATLPK
jgi:beta-barrel assembly-enhancing protease